MRVDIDQLFGALADQTRRVIIEDLAVRNGQTLFELCVRMITVRKFAMSRQAISKHLIVLEEAGPGVRFTMPPAVMGPTMVAVLDDTCGNLIALNQIMSSEGA